MAKSKVQFQKGFSLFEFLKDYGTEVQCENALFTWRFPHGFVCPECANKTCCRLKRRPRVWQCNHCRRQMSLTENMIFANSKLPLPKWFLALHLLSQTKTGLSVMELKRQLGVIHNTAWMLKLLQAMKEYDDKQPICGSIQLDDVSWGGKRWRDAAGKAPFVAAVARNKKGHPIKIRMTVVNVFKTKTITDWAKRHVASASAVISDGLACFKAAKQANCEQLGVVTGGSLGWLDHPAFNWVNTMLGNVKNSLRGSCHTFGAKHLPRYLAEYCFRFNHRFDLKSMLVELGHAIVASPLMPYQLLKLTEGHG